MDGKKLKGAFVFGCKRSDGHGSILNAMLLRVSIEFSAKRTNFDERLCMAVLTSYFRIDRHLIIFQHDPFKGSRKAIFIKLNLVDFHNARNPPKQSTTIIVSDGANVVLVPSLMWGFNAALV